MTALYIILAIVLVLLAAVCLAVRGRTGHPGLKNLQGWSYAHRGLHGDGIPENSMAAFRAALDHGYGIELDIHLLQDGELAVIHDSKLERTTGASGHIEDLNAASLPLYHLEGTDETIPLFRQVLDLYQGKAPLIVELKPERGNHAALAQAACKMLDTYPGHYCIESFDPRCIRWLRKNRPDIIRGQLTENFFRGKTKLPWYLSLALTHNLMNFWTKPDFVAYKFADRKQSPTNWVWKSLWGIQAVTWTLRTKEDYDTAVREGWLPIFEYFKP